MNLTFLSNELLESMGFKSMRAESIRMTDNQLQRESQIIQRILEDGNKSPRWGILLHFQSLGFPANLIVEDLNRLVKNEIIRSNLSVIGLTIFSVI